MHSLYITLYRNNNNGKKIDQCPNARFRLICQTLSSKETLSIIKSPTAINAGTSIPYNHGKKTQAHPNYSKAKVLEYS
jgi:hypothetical protein